MIATLIVLAILIALILLIFTGFLPLHGKKTIPHLKRTMHGAPAVPLPDQDFGLPDVHADLRQFLKKGVDQIFNEEIPPEGDRTKPLTRRDIEPQIFEEVMGYIASLSHFRTQQIQMQKLLNDPAVQMADLSKIILSDPVMTAKVLRMANSSYFGLQQKIDSISHALMLLGLQNIKNILYREGMREMFRAESALHKEAVAALWRHSSIASVCAQNFYSLFDGLNRGTLFTLGIIHDIGKLIILELPQAKRLNIDFWERYPAGVSVGEEDQSLGINHAVIGGLALEHWNFSEVMIDVIKAHHIPSYVEADKTGLSDEKIQYIIVLFLADQLARLFMDWHERIIRPYPLCKSYLSMIDKNKLISKILDASFLAQIRDAEILASDEKGGRTDDGPGRHERTPKVFSASAAASHGASFIQTIGRYEVVREIGRGTMGIVYLAKDPLINREVAIKTLRYQEVDEKEIADAKARFFTEAKVVGKLSHPNIVTIYDVGDFRGGTYIAMEFLDGTDLVPFCERQKSLSLSEIIRIISSAAIALDYAHQNGVVHRDIKPGNIRVLENKTVKVIDFGIAGIVETPSMRAGLIWGSPNYMSPEQVSGQALDGRSDLFSLGVIFYELLTGSKPFQAEDLTNLLLQIKTGAPAPIHILAPNVPQDCIAIIDKCLAKEKDQRYANGRELSDALKDCLRKS